jgi:integrase
MFNNYILPGLGSKSKLADIRASDIDKLHSSISKKHQTRANRIIGTLRKAFNLAKRWEWVTDNPCMGVNWNAEIPRNRYLSEDELCRFMNALDKHKEVISANVIKLLIYTGARRGETMKATWSQFDLEQGIWIKPSSHTKQRREHRVPLSPQAIELLKRIKRSAKSDFVFPGREGDHITDVKKSWDTIRRAAKLENIRLHDLRHSYASLLVSGGLSLPVIGALLGHTQSQTTMRYSHLMDAPLRLATSGVGSMIEALTARSEGAV